jgi:hypothetical protein
MSLEEPFSLCPRQIQIFGEDVAVIATCRLLVATSEEVVTTSP